MRSVVILLVAAAWLCEACIAGALYETSFEEGADTPKGWHPPAQKDDWRWENEGHTGKRSISLIGHTDEEGAASWASDPIPIEPNRCYRLTFWYKAEHEAKSRGCGMGPEDVRIAFPYSEDWREATIFFWAPPHMTATPLSFNIYHTKGKAFLDDVTLDAVGVAYLQQDGMVLDRSERLEKGTYIFDWDFNQTTTNICRPVEKNNVNYMDKRIRFSPGEEVIFRFQLGPYKQLSGALSSKLCYYIDGDGVWSASNDGATWVELGRMNDRKDIKGSSKKYEFTIPKNLYPAEQILLKLASTGTLQVDKVRYEAKLSGSPPDLLGRTDFFQGQLIELNNGPLRLRFDQSSSKVVSIKLGEKSVGDLRCKIAQFEKKGIGYKGAGVDLAPATRIKSIEPKKKDAQECIIDVTAERAVSEPMKRMFEATVQLTVVAGQRWFRAKLLSIKNTDSTAYTIRGYDQLLTPSDDSAQPVCYPTAAWWLLPETALGAVMDGSEPFTLGLRKTSDGPQGDITRRLDAKVDPGMTWQGNEPEVVIFISPEREAGALFRYAEEVCGLSQKPASEIAAGEIACEERKQD